MPPPEPPWSPTAVTETVDRADRREAPLPTLSVVVPNYNHGHYLKAALEAHLGQTVLPLEIIVVDDASTDNSCAIAEEFRARCPQIRLVRRAVNDGVNAAMNHGLREARGDYVCFSAADDLVGPEFAARSLDVLARYPTAGVCFSDPAMLLGDSGVVQRLPLFLADAPTMFAGAGVERLLSRGWFAFPGHAVVYRRASLLALGGFVEDLHWYADWFAYSVLALRDGACYVPEVLALFRESPLSYSARGRRDAHMQRQLVYHILDRLDSLAFGDVAGAFYHAALMPELRFRVLAWLWASPRHRRFLSRRLVLRVAARGTWTIVKPYVLPLRPIIHRAVRGWARTAAGRAG